MRLDDLGNRLAAALRDAAQARRQQLGEARAALARVSPEFRVQTESHRLLALWKRLQAASPASVLNRGFAIVRDEAGRPVMRRTEIKAGQPLAAEFADGSVNVRAD